MKSPAKFVFFVSILFLGMPASSEQPFLPLSDLSEKNIIMQTQRCSGFYQAFGAIVSESIILTDDPIEKSRLQSIKKRTDENSDGILKASILLNQTMGELNTADAVNLSVDLKNGYSTIYLRHFIVSESTLKNPFVDPIWANDTASCSALASSIGDIVKSVSESQN